MPRPPVLEPEIAAQANLNLRQQRILQRIQDQGFATIEELALALSVSAQTVRRDIIHLHGLRLVQRFHGGAGTLGPQLRREQKQSPDAEDDLRLIAEQAAALVPDGATLFLDVGATVEAVAQDLSLRRGLTVVTNSLKTGLLFDPSSHDVFVVGGQVRPSDGAVVGDQALAAVRQFRFDLAIIGCSAVEKEGAVMDYDFQKVEVKRAALASAHSAMLVATHSKFNRSARVRIGDLTDFDHVITGKANFVPSSARSDS
ncbi:DeoR/GlpR family DNA-binding transcription regulator [Rhodovibrionaceae bacterium A322]